MIKQIPCIILAVMCFFCSFITLDTIEVSAETTSRNYVQQSEDTSILSLASDNDMTYIYNRWGASFGANMNNNIIERFNIKDGKYSITSYFFANDIFNVKFEYNSDYEYYYTSNPVSYFGYAYYNNSGGNAGGSLTELPKLTYLLYYPTTNYISFFEELPTEKRADKTMYNYRSTMTLDFTGELNKKLFADSSALGDIDVTDTKGFTLDINNNLDNSAQYLIYISPSSAVDGISDSYQKYSWCYQTKQNTYVYKQSLLSDAADNLNQTTDIWGDVFNPTNCWRIPLNLLLSSVPSDSELIGCYAQSNIMCPYQFIPSSGTRSRTFNFSDCNLVNDNTYYLNVVYRTTTTLEVPAHHRSMYAYTYYDDVSQLNINYTVALAQPFTLTNNVYSPVTVGDDGKPIVDDNGNSVGFSGSYSNDIVNIKTNSNPSATGGSASVVINNTPSFNNNPSININTGGSSSGGTAEEFEDVDVTTFNNLWDSATGFFDFVKKVLSLFPLQTTFITSIFVVLLMLRITRR